MWWERASRVRYMYRVQRARGAVPRPLKLLVRPTVMLRWVLLASFLLGAGSSLGADAVKNQNQALSELSQLFFNYPEKPTFGHQFLDPKQLDFSVDSLKHVDDYLEAVRKAKGIDSNLNVVVLRTGAYVGEVIRRNSPQKHWSWLDFETAESVNPKLFDQLGKSVGTAAVLYDGTEFLFPLAKVAKRIANGSEDSVFFYAKVLLTR